MGGRGSSSKAGGAAAGAGVGTAAAAPAAPANPMDSLSPQERQLMAGLAGRDSDKKIREAMGISQDEAMRLANGIRDKLKLPPGGSLRDAARNAKR